MYQLKLLEFKHTIIESPPIVMPRWPIYGSLEIISSKNVAICMLYKKQKKKMHCIHLDTYVNMNILCCIKI